MEKIDNILRHAVIQRLIERMTLSNGMRSHRAARRAIASAQVFIPRSIQQLLSYMSAMATSDFILRTGNEEPLLHVLSGGVA